MISNVNRLPHVFLKPGEMTINAEPTRVSTVLGSCVGITVFSPRQQVGGFFHALLPSCLEREKCELKCSNAFRYVECGLEEMLNMFLKRGMRPAELEVKLFGGADMFSTAVGRSSAPTVGEKNIDISMRLIKNFNLRLISYDVGGTQGRKLMFFTHTGEVLLKRLQADEKVDLTLLNGFYRENGS